LKKNIGLLTYLGQSVVESKGAVPWYMEKRNDNNQANTKKELSVVDREAKEKLKIKKQDPLNTMNKYVDELKRKRDDNSETKTITPQPQKKKTEIIANTSSRIEQLRAERLKRETEERTKTANYLSKVFTGDLPPQTPEQEPPIEIDDRKRRYNSQFHSEIARQNTTTTKKRLNYN